MTVKCKICNNRYSAVNNLNKHVRKKHPGVLIEVNKVITKVYTCYYCNENFNTKRNLLKHIVVHVSRRPTNIICSFENCDRAFHNMKSLTFHLVSDHNENIQVDYMNFKTMEEFNEWKKSVEDKENCQYVRRTSIKPGNKVQYIYFDCHRSYSARLDSKTKKYTKTSVKIGKICPSRIRIHKKENNLSVQFYSTHMWHKNEIMKLRTLCKKSRSKSSGELSTDVPVHLYNGQKVSKVEQLIVANHNKSANISIEMIKRYEDYWMISCKSDDCLYKIEKVISSCSGCVLSCKLCEICIHSYKCTCVDNSLHLNICEHIHACVKANKSIAESTSYRSPIIPVLNRKQSVINNIILDNNLELEKVVSESCDEQTVFRSHIRSKMEMMLEVISNKTYSSEYNLKRILKYCDKILSIFKKNKKGNLIKTAASHNESKLIFYRLQNIMNSNRQHSKTAFGRY